LEPTHAALLFPLLLAAAAKLTHHLGRQLREPAPTRPWWLAALTATPVALVAATSPRGLPPLATITLLLLSALAAAPLAARLLSLLGSRHPQNASTWIFAAGSIAALSAGALGITHQIAAPLAFGVGASWGLLAWANANPDRARSYNLQSLAAVGLILAASEGAVRYTPVGVAWSGAGSRTQQHDLYGWVDVANEEFALLEAGEHTEYPDKGFPVAFSAPGGGVRVVAMGGSTTGGAYQNDDLRDFYPARLSERLPERFEVLNQGVGGWTTWHIRQYLAAQSAALQPDILTLYVGHNDALTQTPMPYRELYAAWQRGGGLGQTSRMLGQLRLYQGLRFFLISLAPASHRVAVPLDHAEDNLRTIIDLVVGRGGKVVLASEGLSPDPGPLADYNDMMARLAGEQEAVAYVDTASALYAQGGQPLFLDDCHLTDAGHRLVADRLYDTLSELIDVSAR
ncbi:MAG: lysophospholipase L1-like esterase, partial [Myxococcota bacterium]